MKNTKEHILQTSLLLFLQKSYTDVTMSEIVKQTGLSKGAIFHYFSSKEALFKEIAQPCFFRWGLLITPYLTTHHCSHFTTNTLIH